MADEWVEFEESDDWGYELDSDFGGSSASDGISSYIQTESAGVITVVPGLAIPELASANFNGSIPRQRVYKAKASILAGMQIYLKDDNSPYSDTEYTWTESELAYPVVSNVSGTLSVLKEGNIISLSTASWSSVYVIEEAWASRTDGTSGWAITSGGNAIFTNVAVRGEVEALSGIIGGFTINSDSLVGITDPDTDSGRVELYPSGSYIDSAGDKGSITITGINNILSLDANNIQVSSGSNGSTLFLNQFGGEVRVGEVNSESGILRVGNRVSISNPTNDSLALEVGGQGRFDSAVTATRFISTVATGTAPFTVSSQTRVDNLNAQFLNSNTAADFFRLADDETVTGTPIFQNGVQLRSTIIVEAPATTSDAANTRLALVAGTTYQLRRVSSSARYKIDITDYPEISNDDFLSIKPRLFFDKQQYVDNNNSTEGLYKIPGFIAEEFDEIYSLKHIVDYEEGIPESILYDRVSVVIVKKIQDLIAENVDLREKINDIEERLAILEGK